MTGRVLHSGTWFVALADEPCPSLSCPLSLSNLVATLPLPQSPSRTSPWCHLSLRSPFFTPSYPRLFPSAYKESQSCVSLREAVCICFSHHLHRGASCERLQLGLEVWETASGSSGVEINRMSRGMDYVSSGIRRGSHSGTEGEGLTMGDGTVLQRLQHSMKSSFYISITPFYTKTSTFNQVFWTWFYVFYFILFQNQHFLNSIRGLLGWEQNVNYLRAIIVHFNVHHLAFKRGGN